MNNLFKTDIFTEFELEDLKQKEIELRYELLIDSKNNDKLEDLAIVLYHKRDYDGAIELYEKVIERDQDRLAEKYAFLGYLHFENDNYQDAIELFEKSLDLNPYPFVFFLLGNAYSRIGEVIKAVKNYDLAIFMNFDIYQAHLNFAKRYETINRFRRALKEYTIAYEIDPRNKEIKSKIDEIKEKLKNKS